ncbi:hypothetical protein CHISP_2697 [Chitinispirillum alkaliphilum]|nr:hypothetical protein CHISP_2697 [Chitinispirillum alkaliphilum]
MKYKGETFKAFCILLVLYIPCFTDCRQTKEVHDIIFTTKSLDTANFISPEDYPLYIIARDGNKYTNVEPFVRLPDYKNYKVIITTFSGGDIEPFDIHIVRSGVISRNSLNVTKYWSDLGDRGDYRKKYFEIYCDYTIRIDTEEREDGHTKRFTRFYRISDEGEFYKVDEEH